MTHITDEQFASAEDDMIITLIARGADRDEALEFTRRLNNLIRATVNLMEREKEREGE